MLYVSIKTYESSYHCRYLVLYIYQTNKTSIVLTTKCLVLMIRKTYIPVFRGKKKTI